MRKWTFLAWASLCVGCTVNPGDDKPAGPMLDTCAARRVILAERVDKQARTPTPWCISQPVYPPEAGEKKIEGYVVVEFDVSEKGVIENIKVVESEPAGYFENAAIASMKRSFYMVSDAPFKSVRRRINFKINPKDSPY